MKGWPDKDFLQAEFPPKEPIVEGLLSTRDLVTCAGRRRHGKTALLTNLCVSLALGKGEFIGHTIPKPRSSLLLLLEDDPGEYQEKLKSLVGTKDDLGGRLRLAFRDDFYDRQIQIFIRADEFKAALRNMADDHKPDLLVIDNLAHVVNADYNDSKLIHELVVEVYQIAKDHNCAVILAAHPRKEDLRHPVKLEEDPESFFETVMGSSHLVNSTGSLWGLQRRDEEDYTVFVGGRQRASGQQTLVVLQMEDDGWFSVCSDKVLAAQKVLNTDKRKNAWKLLPYPPETFRYREGQEKVKSEIRSSSSYDAWLRQLKAHVLVVQLDDGSYRKAAGV